MVGAPNYVGLVETNKIASDNGSTCKSKLDVPLMALVLRILRAPDGGIRPLSILTFNCHESSPSLYLDDQVCSSQVKKKEKDRPYEEKIRKLYSVVAAFKLQSIYCCIVYFYCKGRCIEIEK